MLTNGSQLTWQPALQQHLVFPYYSETESTATPAAVLPPAKLLPDEEDTEVHQEDSARDCQVSDSFAASLKITLCNSQVTFKYLLYLIYTASVATVVTSDNLIGVAGIPATHLK